MRADRLFLIGAQSWPRLVSADPELIIAWWQVSQSPWNEAHGEVKHSVQSLISDVVALHYGAEHVKFMAAGREDLDVRMLGTGEQSPL